MEQVHEKLADILSGQEFYGLEPSLLERVKLLLANFGEWLARLVVNATGALFSPDNLVLTLLATGILVTAGGLVFRSVRPHWVRDVGSRVGFAGNAPAGGVTAADLRHWAAEARAKGDSRLAVRYLYQACLVNLHTAKVISLRPHATNWEYLRQARALPSEGYSSFSQLTRLFERIWYGDEPATDEDFARGDALLTTLLELGKPDAI